MILLRQRSFTSRATKALRRSLVLKDGGIKMFESQGFKTVKKSDKEIGKEIKKAMREKFGVGNTKLGAERSGTIKEIYKGSSINGKINEKAELVSPRATRKQARRRGGLDLQARYHGAVGENGELLRRRDMGYGNYEGNVFRAASGHGYGRTW